MRYQMTTCDQWTGELVDVDMGDWITVTEFGKRMGVGPRRVRHILHHAGMLRPEGRHGRFRIPRSLIAKGFGKGIEKPASGRPFDVLSPAAVAVLAREWPTLVSDYDHERGKFDEIVAAREALASAEGAQTEQRLGTKARIWWVRDSFPDLNHEQIGAVVGVQQPRVSKVLKARDEQRRTTRQKNGV